MQHLRNPESMVETMRFSSRVDISEPNPIAKAEAEAKANGITLGKLNDSNPTKHALASELLPDIYGAEPRGQRYAREALAAFLHEQGNTRYCRRPIHIELDVRSVLMADQTALQCR